MKLIKIFIIIALSFLLVSCDNELPNTQEEILAEKETIKENAIFEFNEDYEYYIVVIVGKEYIENDIFYYDVQEYNDNSYTVYIESHEEFEIGELALVIEIDSDTLFITAFDNGK
jgi:hypothetical protein